MFWINARREHREWQRLIEQVQRWMEEPAQHLFEPVERVSAWSPAQHLYHVAAVNAPILRWLRQQAETPGTADTRGGPNVAGYLVLTLGRFPRGRGQAPEAFRPPDEVERGALARHLGANRAQLDALGDKLNALAVSKARSDHPLLGRFDAGEWLRFGRIHTAHHDRIIRDIRGAGGS